MPNTADPQLRDSVVVANFSRTTDHKMKIIASLLRHRNVDAGEELGLPESQRNCLCFWRRFLCCLPGVKTDTLTSRQSVEFGSLALPDLGFGCNHPLGFEF